MIIAQAMNALDRADAVSMHLLFLDRMFQELGFETEVYSQHAAPQLMNRRMSIEGLERSKAGLVLFHYAGYTDCLPHIRSFRGRKGIIYHNVSPPELFAQFPETQEFCRKGRAQLPELPRVFDFAVGDSEFNAAEMTQSGFANVRTIPIPVESSGLVEGAELLSIGAPTEPDAVPSGKRGPQGDPVRLLMVGRLLPHKGHRFAVQAIPEIERLLGQRVELQLAGIDHAAKALREELMREARGLGIGDRLQFLGELPTAQLRATFRRAHALLVLSDHEGFCIPIIEAFALGVPVLGFNTTAIPETMGGAGILLEDRSAQTIARHLAGFVKNEARRREILERGFERARDFSAQRIRPLWSTLIEDECSSTPRVSWAVPPDPSQEPREVVSVSGDPVPVSIVICTYNRDWVLSKALESLRRLDYPKFEVVVVNGPSTDRTSDVLDRFPEIKRVENPTRNLSVSRNLGIAAASGTLVAFLDDDAVTAPDWLRELVTAFEDSSVGAAGGIVYGPEEDHLQFRHGVIDRNGHPRAVRSEPADFNRPDGETFNIVMGTNCMFRRDVLQAVGGFDENYEYYHDESDLCVRVIRAGFRVVCCETARVWHEFAVSRIRKTQRNLNWYVIVKNTIYSYFRMSPQAANPLDWGRPLQACLLHLGVAVRWFVRGEMSPTLFAASLGRWTSGVAAGFAKGLFRKPRLNLAQRCGTKAVTFRSFAPAEVKYAARRLRLILISQQYPPDPCGGIGAYTAQLAGGLVEAGHHVIVIAEGPKRSTQWAEGVRVIRIPPASPPGRVPFHFRITRRNLARQIAVATTVRRLIREDGVDLVETPLWDAEGFGVAVDGLVPVVVRLQTPMAVAARTQGWDVGPDLQLACNLEWDLVRRADGVVDSLGKVLEVLAAEYGISVNGTPHVRIPFGIPVPELPASSDSGGRPTVLFVGRLERRKGIDVLLAAVPLVLESVPNAEFRLAGDCSEAGGWSAFESRLSGAARTAVKYLGRVSDEERSTEYSRCDVFVAPSRYESFGLIYLEAMAQGKPCIGCDVGGASMLVVPGETGLLVPPEDAPALARALVQLLRDEPLRRRLGSAGRLRVETEFSVEQMVRRSLEFYERVLDARSAND